MELIMPDIKRRSVVMFQTLFGVNIEQETYRNHKSTTNTIIMLFKTNKCLRFSEFQQLFGLIVQT